VPGHARRPGVPGFGGWDDLHTEDPVAALDFYSSLFGCTLHHEEDMGEMGAMPS